LNTRACSVVILEDKLMDTLEAVELASDASTAVSSKYGLLEAETTVLCTCALNSITPYILKLCRVLWQLFTACLRPFEILM
jgi:hypothetical protein